MRSPLVIFCAALVAMFGAGRDAHALFDGRAIPVHARHAYSPVFVCGPAEETLQQGFVAGDFRTSVAISNPGPEPVRFEKRVARGLPFQRSEEPTPIVRDTIAAGQVLEVECDEIRTMLPLSMTSQLRSGVLNLRSDGELAVEVTLSARAPTSQEVSVDHEKAPAQVLQCEQGFGGPDCSLDCRENTSCDIDLFYHANGSVNGAIARGTLLTGTLDAADATAIVTDFRDWVASHESLLGLAALEPSDLAAIVPDGSAAVVDGGLFTHRFSQTYRGFPVDGPEARLAIVAGNFRGVLSFAGTILDPRIDYRGLEAPLAEAAARDSMQAWYRERGGTDSAVTDIMLEDLAFVAVPQRETMGWRARILDRGYPVGTILVSAAVNDGGRAPLLYYRGLRETLEDEQAMTARVEDMASLDLPASATSVQAPIDATALVDTQPLSGQPLLGSVYTPPQCAGDPAADECGEIRLGNATVVTLDAQGGPLSGEDADPRVRTSASGQFLSSPGSAGYGWQDQFYKLLNAMQLLDAPGLNQGRWETEAPQSSFPDGTYRPRILMVYNAPDVCRDQAACAGSFVDISGAAAFDLPLHIPPEGGTEEPYAMVYVRTDVRTVMFHEFGHTLDSLVGRGFLGQGVIGSGCSADGTCVASCVQDTPDESTALAETFADLTQIYLIDRLYPQLPYAQCGILNLVSNGLNGPVHHNECIDSSSELRQFADTRTDSPGYDDDGAPTGMCSHSPGYRQNPIYQAWWKFTHNRDCSFESPYSCTTAVDDPPLEETFFADIAMQAALFALRQSNAQSYDMFFSNMALFLDCRHGEEIGGFFRRTFAAHGVIEDGGASLVCPAICGDGVAEDAEQCDAPDLAGASCPTIGQGFDGGSLGCSAQCTFDTSACTSCGNGVLEAGEACDGEDFGGQSCLGLGFAGGTLSCSPSCQVSTAACTEIPNPSSCPGGGSPGDADCACLPATADEPPDGPGSFLTQVSDPISIATGLSCPGALICGLTSEDGEAVPVCRECPSVGGGDGTVPYGCPCSQDNDCATSGFSGPVTGDFGGTSIELTCWGDADAGWDGSGGICLPRVNEVNPNSDAHPDAGVILSDEREEFARTKWLCKMPCGDLDVPGSGQHECAFTDGPINFDYASCVEDSCEGMPGAACANEGGHCGPNDSCQAECSPANNGTNASGGNPDCQAYGYPDVWQCTNWLATQRCAPPECMNDPSGGGPGDPFLCDGLIYGNLIPQ